MAFNQREQQIIQFGLENNKTKEEVKSAISKFRSQLPQAPIAPAAPERPGFFGRIKQAFGRRQLKVGEAFEEDISGFEKGLRTAGQGAGLATDIIGAGLRALGRGVKAITPDIIEQPFKKVGVLYLQSPAGQASLNAIAGGIETYQKFKEEHPRVAENIESIVNIAALLPVGRAAKPVVQQVERGLLARAGTVLEKQALAKAEKIKGGFVRDLLRPIQTKKVKEAQVARTTETGGGIFKRSIIEPTTQELASERAVLTISAVGEKKTFQQNFNVITKENIKEARKLANDLRVPGNDFIYPKQELLSRLQQTRAVLEESPLVVGDAAKTADKLIAKMMQLVDDSKATGANLLQVRKAYDRWLLTQKPKVFDAASENALTLANKQIRRTVNTFLDEKAPSAGVKKSLQKQSALFEALETIGPKAAKEADSAIGRAFDWMKQALGVKNATVQQIAALVGIGGLGAAATFAPPAAVAGITGFVLFRAGKFALSPNVRKGLGRMLKEIDKRISEITDQAIKRQLQIDVGVIKAILEQEEE